MKVLLGMYMKQKAAVYSALSCQGERPFVKQSTRRSRISCDVTAGLRPVSSELGNEVK